MISFTLYSRSYCHLCDDMLQQLRGLKSDAISSINVIDIDGDDALIVRYDELVPVLIGQKNGEPAVQLCHYFLDKGKVREFLL